MRDFSYTPDQPVADALDRFLKTEWKGFLQCKDLFCSPYIMTSDGMFVLDQLPGCPEVSVFTGGNGRAFKFAILLGRWVHLSYIVRTDCEAVLRHNASGACCYAVTLKLCAVCA